MNAPLKPGIAIACGGTGGHLFPGLAVAEQLVSRGCAVTLFISPKEVDQQAVKAATGMRVVTLPAVGLTRGNAVSFLRGFIRSYRAAKMCLRDQPVRAALAMGGFTSAPPILAARRIGARTFLHESNTIPGRANRWLARVVNQAFVGFPQATERLPCRNVIVTGTPVRARFQPRNAGDCRRTLGLDPGRPVLFVTGGSQGASGINDLVAASLPLLASSAPEWQLLHLTGPNDAEKIRAASAAAGITAVVRPFLAEMESALGASTAVVSRAGASSLAELAAVRAPAVLVPYPAATDDHQFHNARAFEETGAARLLDQKSATPEILVRMILEIGMDPEVRRKMQESLARWHTPGAAGRIAQSMVEAIAGTQERGVTARLDIGLDPNRDEERNERASATARSDGSLIYGSAATGMGLPATSGNCGRATQQPTIV